MVEIPPKVILLHRGESQVGVVPLFHRGSSYLKLPSTKCSLEPPAIFLALLSSY
jgi:hypothetical protein